MRRRVLLCFVLATASGCQGDAATKPSMTSAPPPPPSRIISDGNHNGNPDFFFLPPMVANPSGSSNWDAAGFDGSYTGARAPIVSVCKLEATTTADNIASKVCADPADATLPQNVPATVDVAGQTYQLNWKVPDVTQYTFYRITVTLLTHQLGVADLEVVPNASALKNLTANAGLVQLADNRTLPIKFRIQHDVLCNSSMPARFCSKAVDLSTGGTVETILGNDPSLPSGIIIPPGAGSTTTNIIVTSCPDMHGPVTDLPTFGHCIRVTSTEGSQTFAVPAVVFDCGADAAVHEAGLSFNQERRVTLHRFDAGTGGKPDRLAALPHAPTCNPATHSASTANLSVRGMLASIVHGQFGSAARQAVSLLSPRPAYAAMFIDLGGGGFTNELSDFQFALPAKMEIVDASDGLFGDVGTPLHPTVIVTDLGDEPVNGATVHFFTSDPSTSEGQVATSGVVVDGAGGPGLASIPWTIVPGGNTMSASGRGIASPANNGPRGRPVAGSDAVDTYVDPFQPIQHSFDGPNVTDTPVPVDVKTGAVTFHASGFSSPTDAIGFGAGDYVYMPVPTSGLPPAGWESQSFVPHLDTWSLVKSPFGSAPLQCSSLPPFATSWSLGTNAVPSDIIARKSFNTSRDGDVLVTILIDNDVQVYLDGHPLTTALMTHEGCATDAPLAPFRAHVMKGPHVLAILARDRGSVAFLDASVELQQ